MTRQADLFPHMMDLKAAVARVETTLLTLADLPARVSLLETKMAAYENQAKGGWRVGTLYTTIILTVVGALWSIATFIGSLWKPV